MYARVNWISRRCGQIFLLVVGNVGMIAVVNAWILIPTSVCLLIFVWLRGYYLKTARDVKRLEGISRLTEHFRTLPSYSASACIYTAHGSFSCYIRKEKLMFFSCLGRSSVYRFVVLADCCPNCWNPHARRDRQCLDGTVVLGFDDCVLQSTWLLHGHCPWHQAPGEFVWAFFFFTPSIPCSFIFSPLFFIKSPLIFLLAIRIVLNGYP
jgi:hypothetical protein